MRSGNGKHRRPRQAPALVVAAGVTGSALAIPLLGATSAGAVESNTWDRVAECESGGMWSADLGNGYYGGLQFSQEQWDRFGGGAYAPRPDLASRSQQIKIAEKVFAAQGPKAWPSCSVVSGLTPGGGSGSGSGSGGVDAADPGTDTQAPATPPAGSVKPDPGAPAHRDTPRADRSGDADAGATTATPGAPVGGQPTEPAAGSSIGPSDGPGAAQPPAGTATPEATPGTATPGTQDPGAQGSGAASPDATATPDASATTDPSATGQGKHRGGPAPENSAPVSDNSSGSGEGEERETGRHASRGGDKGGEAPAPGDYTVRPGDNLWHIADEAEVPGGWPALYEANRKAVGDDPDLIKPGQSLDLSEKQAVNPGS
ncbi:transglycosylase family protein [Streptomyces sp. NPDC091272]|uniref:transglycosylase family protein n=1 Tax=Streptomyces sp. NPDC091272 TaxID=3365981 RepID=UPI003829D99B